VWINATAKFEDPLAGSSIEWQTCFFSANRTTGTVPGSCASVRYPENREFVEAEAASQFGFQLLDGCAPQ
jgi:hypothetical protein